MRYIRKLFQITLLACVFSSATLSAASFKDRLISFSAGTALALIAHNVLEYVSTVSHELGHSLTNKFITGDPIRFSVTPQSGIVTLIQPWVGISYYSTSARSRSKLAYMLTTAAGPLAGIAATHLQLYFLSLLEKKYSSTSDTQPTSARWQQPGSFMRELYQASKKQTSELLSHKELPKTVGIAETAFTILKFLRCSRLVGETLYGFTPITDNNHVGDGQVLWHTILNRPSSAYPLLSNRLIAITSTIMVSPLLLGICKALCNTSKREKKYRNFYSKTEKCLFWQ